VRFQVFARLGSVPKSPAGQNPGRLLLAALGDPWTAPPASLVSSPVTSAQILAVEGLRSLVSELEALDCTPVIDIKPVLDPAAER
jgi:hypothetical protein